VIGRQAGLVEVPRQENHDVRRRAHPVLTSLDALSSENRFQKLQAGRDEAVRGKGRNCPVFVRAAQSAMRRGASRCGA
jgi:hypothetical protein